MAFVNIYAHNLISCCYYPYHPKQSPGQSLQSMGSKLLKAVSIRCPRDEEQSTKQSKTCKSLELFPRNGHGNKRTLTMCELVNFHDLNNTQESIIDQ